MATDPASRYLPRLIDPLLDELLLQLAAIFVVGPRAAGKTTTIGRRAETVVRLDRGAEAAAFEADPDSALAGLAEPVLLDEWQNAPGVLGAVRRAVESDTRPNRFFVTGSVRAELDNEVWPATGRLVRLAMYPMTIRELQGSVTGDSFFDKLAAGRSLSLPSDVPDLRGYVALAMRSGFPVPALGLSGLAREVWFASYLDDLLTHDVEQVDEPVTRRRDVQRLRRYFEAVALNSAGVVPNSTLYNVAQISKQTAAEYDELLAALLIVEEIPAWSTNRLKRLVRQSKRYVVDPALVTGALRMNEDAVLADGNVLGRLLDTFVVAQLRPELVVSRTQPRLHHLRTEQGRHEVDLIAELAGERVLALEVRATASPRAGDDDKHLRWLKEELGERFLQGVLFHTGPRIYELGPDIVAVPIAALWSS